MVIWSYECCVFGDWDFCYWHHYFCIDASASGRRRKGAEADAVFSAGRTGTECRISAGVDGAYDGGCHCGCQNAVSGVSDNSN